MTDDSPMPPDSPRAGNTPGSPGETDVPPGSRLEIVWMCVTLAADLISGPFHLVGFLLTRRRQRRRFLQALREGAALPENTR